ncbi:S26 family signal peptidase [Kitasatospora sp. NBC_00240]|uniref:S26 family signal peptidase n=1 Tax=Kitasatospora sp. NBC_00240 TaxID=2903567 RepID=UPI00224E07DB|nr:S26 family signal peptidase [Kitasatospora sp. NBC_00240]MCX5207777.1 S26 family signal peptidase [Kitasatospora sp. NBC_00240]
MTVRLVRWVHRVLRGRVLAVTVTGPSMEPGLRDGDRVLVVRRPARRLRRGQVVVLGPRAAAPVAAPEADWAGSLPVRGEEPPGLGPLLIKRIAAAPGDLVPAALAAALGCPPGTTVPPGRFLVLGDNEERSLDSRHFGHVTREQVVGVAVRPLRPAPAGR